MSFSYCLIYGALKYFFYAKNYMEGRETIMRQFKF